MEGLVLSADLEGFLNIVWGATDFTDPQLETVKSVLLAAGFQVESLAVEEAYDWHRDQDGSALDRFTFNRNSGINVGPGNRATYWLEMIWSKIKALKNEPTKAIEFLRQEIARSVPMKPIVVSEYGDALREYPPGVGLVEHTKDNFPMSMTPGVHAVCNGWMDLRPISSTHNAISCRVCHLRVAFPKTIKTYGDLRAHFAHLESP